MNDGGFYYIAISCIWN